MEGAYRIQPEIDSRVKLLPPEIFRRFSESSGRIVFGSFAAGVNGPSSDLDIFCIGDSKTHFKSEQLEILILPEFESYSDMWLGSELANHIASYGIPLERRPDWMSLAHIQPEAIEKKVLRIGGYIRGLERYWPSLSVGARARYETKLRREMQRLLLLQAGRPVPATKLLDHDSFAGFSDITAGISLVQRKTLDALFPQLNGWMRERKG